ncbi:MAG: mechanosensitive ion channel [Bacteroidia bacterium]|nr:mechanosensitive ion channel [Bacteroidia bacterium]
MERYNIQFIQSAIVIIGYLITYFITKNYINNTLKNAQLQRARRKVIIKVIQFFTTLTLVVLLGAIWGLKQSEIAVFVSTILTALGIAFFAQWSLLSNITSSIIIFLNHPLRIGDYIKIIDKDAPIEGEIADLTYFFVHIKTNDGETITIPNTMFLQKTIMIINKQS